jgi:hydroxyacylglutathione hydrolase
MLTLKSFAFNPLAENTYVLSDQKDACVIIDPGCYFDNERTTLQEYIEQQGLSPKILLNTHCHLDHVFGNKFVGETWDLPLHLHEKELPVLDAAPAMGREWGMPFENYSGELVLLTPGETILPGEDRLSILFLPGHSPGGDHATLLRSIREQLLTLPNDTIVYPGHGEPTTVGHERAHNPFLRA